MVITKEFYFRGWLPAGLVINSRLLDDTPAEGVPVLRPIINSRPGSSWPMYQPRPAILISQATAISAIILKDPLPESTLALLPLGDWYGPGTPYVLAINTWYDGRIQYVSGGDVPSVRIILSDIHLYLMAGELDPGSLPDTCVGAMPARILPGANQNSALFVDAGMETASPHTYGMMPMIPADTDSQPARYMNYLMIKPSHTAGLAYGMPKGSGPDQNEYFLECDLVSGRATPPEGAGKINYYGIMPICKEEVQPISLVGSTAVMGAAWTEPANLLMPMGPLALAYVNTTGDDQLIHYN